MKLPNMTPREKASVLLALAAVVLMVVFLTVRSVTKGYKDLDQQIVRKQEELQKVAHLCEQYRQTHQDVERVQAKLDDQKRDFSLLSFIEDLANKQNIRENIGSVKPKKLPLTDNYEETIVEMQFNDITLPHLVDFIFKIEHSGHVLKVKRLRIKTRYNDRNLLYGTMQVATYTKKS